MAALSAVAAMLAKPVIPSVLRSSQPPPMMISALPRAILSTASSRETAAVAQAATGCTIGP